MFPLRFSITLGVGRYHRYSQTKFLEVIMKKENTRFIRIREVIRLTGISKSYIYQLCNDNQFPKSIQLVPGGKSVAWLESEVMDWIDSRVIARDEVA